MHDCLRRLLGMACNMNGVQLFCLADTCDVTRPGTTLGAWGEPGCLFAYSRVEAAPGAQLETACE